MRKPRGKSDKAPSPWIWGSHAVLAALANPDRQWRRLLATRNTARDLPHGVEPEVLEPGAISTALPQGAVHQGLALEAEPLPELTLPDILHQAPRLLVVLDQVTDPHNVGAILRSAAAFGAGALVTTDRHAPPMTGVLAKAAAGAVEHVPMVRVGNLAQALATIGQADVTRIGLAEDGDQPLGAFAIAPPLALVLGAEGPGLRRLTRERCDHVVHLPTKGPIASLNVSNAAAIALYELSRGQD